MNGMDLADYLTQRFGHRWMNYAMLRMLRAGRPHDVIQATLGKSKSAISSFARRNRIPLQRKTPEYTFIYTLSCPMDGQVKWVGKSNRPAARLHYHFQKPTNIEMVLWLESLKEQGLRPVVKTIARVKYQFWRRAEHALMLKYDKISRLLNQDFDLAPRRFARTGSS